MNLQSRLSLSILSAFALAAIAAASCAPSVEDTVILGGVEDSGVGPGVFGPEDAADGAADSAPAVPMCVATECPYPYATCETPDELVPKCRIDLSSDNRNCGACGNECPVFFPLNMFSRCANSRCVPQCLLPYLDCNKQLEDGCETDTRSDVKNCGACGNACPEGVECIDGSCGCPPGRTRCGTECIDLATNGANCGACGNVCDHSDAGTPPRNMQFVCQGGQCGQRACIRDDSVKWDDCNHDLADGCEIDLAAQIAPRELDPNNCGACGVACAPGEKCRLLGGVASCGCPTNETLCGEAPYLFCVNLQNNVKSCGACRYECPYPYGAHQEQTCTKGVCGTKCENGFGDCNGNPADGCETDLNRNAEHCGACGVTCDLAAGQPCIAGKCLMAPCSQDGGQAK